MFALLTKTMEQLDKDEIDVFNATAQAKLMDSAGRMLNYELKRATGKARMSPPTALTMMWAEKLPSMVVLMSS